VTSVALGRASEIADGAMNQTTEKHLPEENKAPRFRKTALWEYDLVFKKRVLWPIDLVVHCYLQAEARWQGNDKGYLATWTCAPEIVKAIGPIFRRGQVCMTERRAQLSLQHLEKWGLIRKDRKPNQKGPYKIIVYGLPSPLPETNGRSNEHEIAENREAKGENGEAECETNGRSNPPQNAGERGDERGDERSGGSIEPIRTIEPKSARADAVASLVKEYRRLHKVDGDKVAREWIEGTFTFLRDSGAQAPTDLIHSEIATKPHGRRIREILEPLREDFKGKGDRNPQKAIQELEAHIAHLKNINANPRAIRAAEKRLAKVRADCVRQPWEA